MVQYKRVLDTMAPYKPGKPIEETQREYGIETIVKLASNENPYGYSPLVAKWLKEEAHELALYPDANATNLREVVAKRYDVAPESLIFGNGSDELISIIARTFFEPGTHTVVPTPSFTQYVHNAKVEGADFTEVPLREDGHHDYEAMLQAIRPETRVVWICNPNNPTGTLLRSDELKAFIDQIDSRIFIVLDEAYVEYITDPDYVDTLNWLEEYDNLILLRTFSKAYGLASIRIGYGIGHERVIEQLNKVRNPFNNNTLAHTIAQIAIEDQSFIETCRTKNETERKRYEQFATQHGLHMYPSQTNFVLLETTRGANEVSEQLLRQGIIVRSGDLLGTPGYIRVTIGTKEQNDVFFEAYEQLLN